MPRVAPPEPEPPEEEGGDETDEESAEEFANEWGQMKAQMELQGNALESMSSKFDDILAAFGKSSNDTPSPTSQPGRPSKGTTRQPRSGGTPSGSNPDQTSAPRIPDVKPEESHWYWRPRFRRGG